MKTVRYFDAGYVFSESGRSPGGHTADTPRTRCLSGWIQHFRAPGTPVAAINAYHRGKASAGELVTREPGRVEEQLRVVTWRRE